MHIGSQNGHPSIVQLLVDAGADIDAVTDKGYTGLILAANNGHCSTVEVLLRNGADANQRSEEGYELCIV